MNNLYCPVCGTTGKKFIDFLPAYAGMNPELCIEKTNIVCPECYSLPRHRLFAHYLLQYKFLPKGVLLAGRDPYLERFFTRRGSQAISIDLSAKDVNIKANIQDTPFADESWNMIISSHVLEHVVNLEIAISELKRILKPDGILLFAVPKLDEYENTFEDENLDYKQRIEKMGQADHLRIFGRDFVNILEDNALEVTVISGDEAPENIRAITGPVIFDENKIYLCKKTEI